MNTPTINQQLQEIYQSYLASIYAQTWEDDVSAPLLMNVFPEYENMEKKILFVGQETHSWGQMNNEPKLTVEDLQTMYQKFNLGKAAFYDKPKYLTSPFWNFSRSFFYNLNYQNAEVSRKTNGFLWTNISKFDHNSTTPSQDLQDRNEAGFELLKKEIAILKPDIVIFLTGSKYDPRIDKVFNPKREVIIPDGFLSKLIVTDESLPVLTFQTKHPRTLIGAKKANIPNRYHEVLKRMTELLS